MLQTQIEPQYEIQEQGADFSQYFAIAKKRIFFFLIPFVLVSAAGIAVAMLWPPTYLSEGKILVETQQIPTELVRPTVSSTAKERIQVIQQRVTTRDNLLALADKYKLYADRRDRLSRTELLDLMRESFRVEPIELDQAGGQRNQTIAVKVGFMDRQPDVATKVANELMTLFLNEDARNRTNRAMETTRFLAREAQRLEAELAAVEVKIAEVMKQYRGSLVAGIGGGQQQPSLLATLQAEFAQKSAVYRASHPELRRLSAQIAALEKADPPTPLPPQSGAPALVGNAVLDGLVVQRASVQKSLETANQKHAAARLGETLERDQFSERLEVLEQAVAPQKPLKPNRFQIIVIALFAAMVVGAAAVFAVETFDRTIRGSHDLFKMANSHLIVAIPYISTDAELARTKMRRLIIALLFVLGVAGALASVHFYVRPLDELWSILISRIQDGVPRW